MSALAEHDRKIAEANALVAELAAKHFDWKGETYFNAITDALKDRAEAIAAKREAERPKLLTAEEAQNIYDASCGPLALEHPKAVQAVLTASVASALRVIEALPRHRTHPPCDESAVEIDDIRRALGHSAEGTVEAIGCDQPQKDTVR